MKKLFVLSVLFLLMTGCTSRIQLIPECKDGVLHYTYIVTQQELNIVEKNISGILQYQDGTPVKCVI